MSIKMNITVNVPLAVIADIKDGKKLDSLPSGYELYSNIMDGVTKAAKEFPYDIAKAPGTPGKEFEVYVKTTAGKTVTVHVRDSDTIDQLACKIEDKEGIPPNYQRLHHQGRLIYDRGHWEDEEALQNHRTLAALGIGVRAMLYLTTTLRGS